jgi:hypothetical protein
MLRRLFRIVATAAALILVAAFWYEGSLDSTYVSRSREPSPAEGLVVPYHVKGITVFITRDERQVVTSLQRTEIAAGAFVLIWLIFSGELARKLRGQ